MTKLKYLLTNDDLKENDEYKDLQKEVIERIVNKYGEGYLGKLNHPDLLHSLVDELELLLDEGVEENKKLRAEMDLRMNEFEDNSKNSEVLRNRYERLKKTFVTHQNLSKTKYVLEILFPVAVGIFAVTVSILNISPLK